MSWTYYKMAAFATMCLRNLAREDRARLKAKVTSDAKAALMARLFYELDPASKG